MSELLREWLGDAVDEALRSVAEAKKPEGDRTANDEVTGSGFKVRCSRDQEARKHFQLQQFASMKSPIAATISDSHTSVLARFSEGAVKRLRERDSASLKPGAIFSVLTFDVCVSRYGVHDERVSLLIEDFAYKGVDCPSVGRPTPLVERASTRMLLEAIGTSTITATNTAGLGRSKVSPPSTSRTNTPSRSARSNPRSSALLSQCAPGPYTTKPLQYHGQGLQDDAVQVLGGVNLMGPREIGRTLNSSGSKFRTQETTGDDEILAQLKRAHEKRAHRMLLDRKDLSTGAHDLVSKGQIAAPEIDTGNDEVMLIEGHITSQRKAASIPNHSSTSGGPTSPSLDDPLVLGKTDGFEPTTKVPTRSRLQVAEGSDLSFPFPFSKVPSTHLNVPLAQANLLERKDSWQHPEPGINFPGLNVPRDILSDFRLQTAEESEFPMTDRSAFQRRPQVSDNGANSPDDQSAVHMESECIDALSSEEDALSWDESGDERVGGKRLLPKQESVLPPDSSMESRDTPLPRTHHSDMSGEAQTTPNRSAHVELQSSPIAIRESRNSQSPSNPQGFSVRPTPSLPFDGAATWTQSVSRSAYQDIQHAISSDQDSPNRTPNTGLPSSRPTASSGLCSKNDDHSRSMIASSPMASAHHSSPHMVVPATYSRGIDWQQRSLGPSHTMDGLLDSDPANSRSLDFANIPLQSSPDAPSKSIAPEIRESASIQSSRNKRSRRGSPSPALANKRPRNEIFPPPVQPIARPDQVVQRERRMFLEERKRQKEQAEEARHDQPPIPRSSSENAEMFDAEEALSGPHSSSKDTQLSNLPHQDVGPLKTSARCHSNSGSSRSSSRLPDQSCSAMSFTNCAPVDISGPSKPATDGVFGRFKASYPVYGGDQKHFHGRCRAIDFLQKHKKLHRSLWDDFVIRHKTNYIPFAAQCTEDGEDAQAYEDYYDETFDEPTHKRKILTPGTLKVVLDDEARAAASPKTRAVQTPSNRTPTSYQPMRRPQTTESSDRVRAQSSPKIPTESRNSYRPSYGPSDYYSPNTIRSSYNRPPPSRAGSFSTPLPRTSQRSSLSGKKPDSGPKARATSGGKAARSEPLTQPRGRHQFEVEFQPEVAASPKVGTHANPIGVESTLSTDTSWKGSEIQVTGISGTRASRAPRSVMPPIWTRESSPSRFEAPLPATQGWWLTDDTAYKRWAREYAALKSFGETGLGGYGKGGFSKEINVLDWHF